MTKDSDCPFYDGVGEIPESDSPYVIILDANRKFALRVRRKFVEGGIPEDPGALLDEALAGDLEDWDEAGDCDGESEEMAADNWDGNDLWIFDRQTRERMSQTNEEIPNEKS